MVEEDPDEETYYEMGDQNSNSVPVSPVELLWTSWLQPIHCAFGIIG